MRVDGPEAARVFPEEDVQLLCLLVAQEQQSMPVEECERFGLRLFERVLSWVQDERLDLLSLANAIGVNLKEACRLDRLPVRLVSRVFDIACAMYRGRVEPATARQAILYAGLLRRLGLVNEKGEGIDGSE